MTQQQIDKGLQILADIRRAVREIAEHPPHSVCRVKAELAYADACARMERHLMVCREVGDVSE